MADTTLLQSIVKLTRPLFIILSLALCGCIQMHTTVHVRKDGSGTIEEKMLFSEMLSGIMKEKGEGLPALPKKDQLREMSAEFGPDVKVVNVKKVENSGDSGFIVTYAFDDIEKVRIGNVQKMSKKLTADSTAVKSDSTAVQKPETWFTFTMKRGANPELTINKEAMLNSSSRGEVAKKPVSTQEKEQMLDMISAFLKGMKLEIDVVVDGRVISSDASYRTDNTITLYAMDFDQLMAHRDILTGKYDGLSDRDFARRSGKDSGLKFEFKDKVHVIFN